MRVGRRTGAAVLLPCTLVILLAGCTSPDPPDTPRPTGSAEERAAPSAAPGAPDYCVALVSSEELTSLPAALRELTDPATMSDARTRIVRAAEHLESPAVAAAGSPAVDRLAEALRALAIGDASPQEWQDVSEALTTAGEEMQDACEFPLG